MTGSHTHDHGHHHHPAMPARSGATATPWPVEIRLKRSERVLEVTYEGGDTIRLDAEYLRVESPSAEVQGFLAQLAREHDQRWQAYLDGLAAAGLSRD